MGAFGLAVVVERREKREEGEGEYALEKSCAPAAPQSESATKLSLNRPLIGCSSPLGGQFFTATAAIDCSAISQDSFDTQKRLIRSFSVLRSKAMRHELNALQVA